MTEHDANRTATDRLAIAWVCLMTLAVGGCHLFEPKTRPPARIDVGPPGTIAASEMGNRLGLRVRRQSASSATLGDRLNSVVFFADPGGVAYVNGRKVGRQGGLATVGKRIFVPEYLEREIRRVLKRRPRVAPKRRYPVVASMSPPAPPQFRYGPVLIDAGHGGNDPGAIQNGYNEKDLNLDIALMVAERLKNSGVDVRMTRTTDIDIPLNDRAALAGEIGAKLFVSLHCDSAPNRRARGFTIYAPANRRSQTKSFAAIMERSMRTTPMKSRGIRSANFRVLARTKCPALLVEMGYLSNRYESRVLASASCKRIMARAVANGVTRYLTK